MNEEIMKMFEIVTPRTEFNNYKSIQQANMKKLEDRINLIEKKVGTKHEDRTTKNKVRGSNYESDNMNNNKEKKHE
jgi:hypothetical protein